MVKKGTVKVECPVCGKETAISKVAYEKNLRFRCKHCKALRPIY